MKTNVRRLLLAVLFLAFAGLACNIPNMNPNLSDDELTKAALTNAAYGPQDTQTSQALETSQAANLNATATEIYARGTALAASYLTPTITDTPLPAGPVLVNPGFEAGIDGWTDINSNCGSKSDADSTEAHSGTQSRKLYLRYCGSYISQTVHDSLPAGSSLTLKVWAKMPAAGDQANKVFTLSLVISSASGQTSKATIDVVNAMPDWTQLTVGPLVADFPVSSVEVIAETDKGGGDFNGYDRPVWIDDFELVSQTH